MIALYILITIYVIQIIVYFIILTMIDDEFSHEDDKALKRVTIRRLMFRPYSFLPVWINTLKDQKKRDEDRLSKMDEAEQSMEIDRKVGEYSKQLADSITYKQWTFILKLAREEYKRTAIETPSHEDSMQVLTKVNYKLKEWDIAMERNTLGNGRYP